MENYDYALQSGFNNADLNALSSQLNDLLAAYDATLQKTDEISAELMSFEARQGYLEAALEEGQRIASEALRNAELRVENIIAGSNRIVMPQKKLIARIETEISELTQTLESLTAAAGITEPGCKVPSDSRLEWMLDEELPLDDSLSDINKPTVRHELMEEMPLAEDSESTRKAPAAINIDLLAYTPPVETAVTASEPEPETERAAAPLSVNDRLSEDPREEISAADPPEALIYSDLPLIKSQEQIPLDRSQAPAALPPAGPASAMPVSAMAGDDRKGGIIAVTVQTTPEESHDALQLDMNMLCRFLVNKNQNSEYLYHHEWLLKIDTVPAQDRPDAEQADKVSAIIGSALQCYDNVVLNDVYPFDMITPNLTSIGHYFFNCLDDRLTALDLHLKQIRVYKNDTMIMRVNKRSKEIDAMIKERL